MSSESAADQKIRELTARLKVAEDTLRAVRSGSVDAVIVQGAEGEPIDAARNADQPYRDLVEDMLEGAAILSADGNILFCNHRFAELVDLPPGDVLGGTFERFVTPLHRPIYRSLIADANGMRRTQLAAANGRAVEVFLSLTTSTCDHAEHRNLVITDLSRLLDAHSSCDGTKGPSHAKDEFIAMLAHELRTPLSAITAAVQVLEVAQGRDKPSARARSIIARQVQHLSRLVDDLLDVSRVITGKIVLDRQAVDLGELVRRTVSVFGERESRHRITCTTAPVWVDGDAVRIEQIVSNILGNAVKYTPHGGKVSVSLSDEAECAVLRVEDTGFGIAPELLPVIFDLFAQGERTLERAQGGLGIGLTLVRRLVELHGGTVSAESDGSQRGSRFTVRLPNVPAPRARGVADSRVLSTTVKRRVLIIEDNQDAREMFRMMLELAGHDVIEADEGCCGLDLLKSQMPDVAFIDVGLPGLDGYEIVSRFRNETAGNGNRVLLVALTGYGTPDALERSRCAGFDHHLIKPVNPETLYKLLDAPGPAGSQLTANPSARAIGAEDSSSATAPDVTLQ